MFHCPFCDAMLSDDGDQSGRCPHCGSRVHWNDETGSDTPPAVETPEPKPAPASEPPRLVDSNPSFLQIVSTIVGRAAFENISDSTSQSSPPPAPLIPLSVPPVATPAPSQPTVHATIVPTSNVSEIWKNTYAPHQSPSLTLKATQLVSEAPQGLVIRQRMLRTSGEYGVDSADYELLERIGEGGVGTVFAARQTNMDRTVAIKMLKGEAKLEADSRHKFLSEAVVTGDLDHPNIVPVYDLGSDERGALFYSMKRVVGTAWSECIATKSLTQNLEILMKVADAIAFAHSRGVVHRDIKPENVMLGEFGEVLVMDWGIALSTSLTFKAGKITQSNSMGGTPAYMAPEMATGPIDQINLYSDVYLLGAVLFEIVAGKTPHTGRDVITCLYAAARNEIQPTDKSGELLDIAMRAMATAPPERYHSVRAFQDAIRAYQSHSESIALARRAADDLEKASSTGDYQAFARAIFACQEALGLWPQNEQARELLVQAQLAYGQSAFDKGDYDLGLSLLDPNNIRHAALARELAASQRERNARQARLTQFRRTAIGLAATIFIVVSGGLVYIYGQNKQLDEGKKQLEGTITTLNSKQIELDTTNVELASQRDDLDRKKTDLEKTNVQLSQQRQIADESARAARTEERRAEQTSYLARMGLAAAQSRENAFLNIRESLAAYERPPLAHWRHWEWGRLQYITHLATQDLAADGRIECLALLPDNPPRVVSGSASGVLQVWNTNNWQVEFKHRYDAPIRACAVSRDGRRLALALQSADDQRRGEILLWTNVDWAALANRPIGEPTQTLRGHQGDVVSLAFAKNGQHLASSSLDQTARYWNLQSSESTVFTGHAGPVWRVALAPDDSLLVTAGDDRTVGVWKLDGKRLHRFRGHKGPVYAVAIAHGASSEGFEVVSAGQDRQVLLWNTSKVKEFDFAAMQARLTATDTGATDPVAQTNAPSDFRVLGTHAADVRSLEFTPDDRFVISGGQDNTVRMWKPAAKNDRELAYRTLRGHGGWVAQCIALNNEQVVSGSYDQTLKAWKFADYAEHLDLHGHDDAVVSAVFSRDGQRVITAGRDRKAIVWNALSGEAIASLSEGHEFLTSTALYFGQDDDRLVTSAGDGSVIIWSRATGGQLLRLTGTGSNAALAMSPDKQWLATGSTNSEVLLWPIGGDLQKIEPVRLPGHGSQVTTLCFGSDANDNLRLFSGDASGQGRLWRLAPGSSAWTSQPGIAGHYTGFAVNAARFVPDGSKLVTAGADHRVKQWNAATGAELPDSTLQMLDSVRLLGLTPDGLKAVTVSADQEGQLLELWDLQRTERLLQKRLKRDTLQAMAIAPDGRSVALGAATATNNVWRWDLETGEFTPFWSGARLRANTFGLAWSPDASELLTVGGNHARVWSVKDGERKLSFSPHGPLVGADFSIDGERALTADEDGSLKIWKVADQRVLHKFAGIGADDEGKTIGLLAGCFVPSTDAEDLVLATGVGGQVTLWKIAAAGPQLVWTISDPEHAIACAAPSYDGATIITGSTDGSARIWSTATGKQLGSLTDPQGHKLAIRCLAAARDGRFVVTGSEDNLALVWDLSTRKLVKRLAGHTASLTSAGFSPDGQRVVTSSNDGTAKLWDVETGREIVSLDAHQYEVTAVSFSPEGRRVLTGSRDQHALIWNSAAVEPALSWGEAHLVYRTAGEATVVDAQPGFTDPDVTTFAGARLQVQVVSPVVSGLEERLTVKLPEQGWRQEGRQIQHQFLADGPFVNVAELQESDRKGGLSLHLSAAATHAIVETLLAAIHYSAGWQTAPPQTMREIEAIYTDADGQASPAAKKTIEFEATATASRS